MQFVIEYSHSYYAWFAYLIAIGDELPYGKWYTRFCIECIVLGHILPVCLLYTNVSLGHNSYTIYELIHQNSIWN